MTDGMRERERESQWKERDRWVSACVNGCVYSNEIWTFSMNRVCVCVSELLRFCYVAVFSFAAQFSTHYIYVIKTEKRHLCNKIKRDSHAFAPKWKSHLQQYEDGQQIGILNKVKIISFMMRD